MKIVVLGALGQFAQDFHHVAKFVRDHDVTMLSRQACDVTNRGELRHALATLGPGDVVVNTACQLFAQDAEAWPQRAFEVDAVGAGNVAQEATIRGATVVYVSSDYVFGGEKTAPYIETDWPYPINVYGTSKFAGERLTAQFNEKHVIVRLAALFGADGRTKRSNFVCKMAARARELTPSKVVDDTVISPTYALDAAAALVKILERGDQYGIFHLANAGETTWFELAKFVYGLFGIKDGVQQIESDRTGVHRPERSSLASIRLQPLGIKMPAWQEAVESYLRRTAFLASQQDYDAYVRCRS